MRHGADMSSSSSYPSDCEFLEEMRNKAQTRKNPLFDDTTLIAKAAPVRLLLLDVDGVLTDGTLIYDKDGNESKGFNTQDGFGIRMLQDSGVDVGIITARNSEAVKKRSENLNLRYLHMGESNKLIAFNKIVEKGGYKPFEISYMGDDWLDMILLKRVGLAAAPANAVPEVQHMAHYVTQQGGGHGAVRELCTLILHAKGLLDKLLQSYMNR